MSDAELPRLPFDALRRAAARGARHLADALRDAAAPQPRYLAGYRGYGDGTRSLVLARALEGAPLAAADAAQGRLRNLRDTLRRVQRDPVRWAAVRGALGDTRFDARADDEGFVRQWVTTAPLAPGRWHPVTLALAEPPTGAPPTPPDGSTAAPNAAPNAGSSAAQPATPGAPAREPAESAAPAAASGTAGGAEASVLVPRADARFGIVSDLDDTVLQSDATNFLRAAQLVLFENARTRLPFPGVAALYRALVDGASGDAGNPLFYVSSSPWNLYDVIADFLDVQQVPSGPILLRDWDLGPGLTGHRAHKRAAIAEILATYPHLPFILVGDSGQEDPEVYRDLVHDHPSRILAVYIRDVSRDAARDRAVQALAEEVRAARSELVLAPDSRAIAAHAAERGWIAAAAAGGVAGAAVAERAVSAS